MSRSDSHILLTKLKQLSYYEWAFNMANVVFVSEAFEDALNVTKSPSFAFGGLGLNYIRVGGGRIMTLFFLLDHPTSRQIGPFAWQMQDPSFWTWCPLNPEIELWFVASSWLAAFIDWYVDSMMWMSGFMNVKRYEMSARINCFCDWLYCIFSFQYLELMSVVLLWQNLLLASVKSLS